jgi:hypothetical protein
MGGGHRRFVLNRTEDISGISGTGVIAEGVLFSSGKAVLNWTVNTLAGIPSVTVFDSIEQVETIHGHGGATRIEWLDS